MTYDHMTSDHVTGSDNYFENFEIGAVYKHARGKTVTENEAVTICHMVMNTADAHFNDARMARAVIGTNASIVFGGVTLSIVIGHGDTLYAYTEVLEKSNIPEMTSAGKILFRHYGVNQHNKVVFQGDRTALLRKKEP